eukprot:1044128-Pleurochrysis_carterae.AAC.3
MASSSLYLLSVTLEAAVRQQTGQSMLVWTYSDIGEVCEFLTGCFAYGYAFQRKKPGIAVASGILCCIFNVLVVYGMKRIANTLTWTFRERTRSFAFSFGSMQIKWFVFQVFVSIARTRCLFAFPFQVGDTHAMPIYRVELTSVELRATTAAETGITALLEIGLRMHLLFRPRFCG